MDPQDIINTATSVGAATLGAADAGEIFRANLRACYVIDKALSKKQLAYIKKYVDFQVIHKPEQAIVGDHPELAVMRDLTRQVYERSFKVSTTGINTLVVGASAREMKLYDANPAIQFYLHNSESKDYERIVTGVLRDIAKNLRKKANRVNGKLVVDESGNLPSAIRRYNDLKSVLKDYQVFGKRPARYHTDPVRAEVLLFEDSFYNLRTVDYLRLFRETGANVAYGYGLLPLELVFEDMPANRMYRLVYDQEHTRAGPVTNKDYVSLVYNGGYANGYRHSTESWKTLLNNVVITDKTFNFSIEVEITSRIGPFAVFKLVRTYTKALIPRSLDLPQGMDYVMVLDTLKSVNIHTGKVRDELVHFPVFANEFYELLNYLLSLDEKSMTVETALLSTRRRSGGVALVGQELLPPWDLQKSDFHRFALSVWLYAKVLREKSSESLESINPMSRWHKLRPFLEMMANVTTFGLWFVGSLIYEWVVSSPMVENLVLAVNPERIQYGQAVHSGGGERVTEFAPVFETQDADCTGCELCDILTGGPGNMQKVKCEAKQSTDCVFSMTDEELNSVRNELASSTDQADWLKKLKTDTIPDVPKTGFSHKVKLRVISGGPGTGKSRAIRSIADSASLILCPFANLKEDYTNVEVNGERVSFNFKTMHKAMKQRGHRVIIVDEYTGFDFRYLKMIAYLNAAEEVILAGDYRQTGIREPSEGQYIWNHLRLQDFDHHELLVNFRNQPDVVWMLNRMGYNLEAARRYVGPSVKVVTEKELPADVPLYRIGFSHKTCELFDIDDERKATVRANQGQDVDDIAVYFTNLDNVLLANPKLLRVAISRGKGTTYLVTDGSDAANAAIASLRYDEFNINDLPVHEKASKDNRTDDEVIQRFVELCEQDDELKRTDFGKKVLQRFGSMFGTGSGTKSSASVTTAEVSIASKFQPVKVDPDINEDKFDKILREYDEALRPQKKLDRVLRVNSGEVESADQTSEAHDDSTTSNASSTCADELSASGKTKLEVQTFDAREDPVTSSTPSACSDESTTSDASSSTDDLHSREATGYISKAVQSLRDLGNHKPEALEVKHSGVFKKIGNKQDYIDTLMKYVPLPLEQSAELQFKDEPEFVRPKQSAVGKDAFATLSSYIPAIGLTDLQTSANFVTSAAVPNNFSNGVIDVDYVTPINMRGHPKKLSSSYLSFCGGSGLHFGSKKIMQLLQCAEKRYAGKKKKYEFTRDAELLAKKIANEFVDEHIRTDFTLDPAEITQITNEAIEAANSKHYEAQFVGYDNPDAKLIRFHLKDIYKPYVLKEADYYKAGQGISAWSKDAQVEFGVAIRIQNAIFKRMCKPSLIYDNRETEESIREKIAAAVEAVPSTALDGITDWGQFDSVQNRFTQAIERQVLERMHVSPEFIEQYYQYRNDYTIQADGARFKAGSEKTSGEPGTLLFNSILSGALSNYLLRGEGPVVLVIKGDDGYKKQCNLVIDENRKLEVEQFVGSGMKLSIGKGAEFCGNVIVDGKCFPSIYRKADKLCAHRFKDYLHFAEYQKSLRDWVKKTDNDQFEQLITVNAKLHNAHYDQTRALWEAIVSVSHINKDQFLQWWKPTTEGHVHMTAHGTVHFD